MMYGRLIDGGMLALALLLGFLIIAHDATNNVLGRWCMGVKSFVFPHEVGAE